MAQLKTCPECGGEMERKRTRFIVEKEGTLIVIEDIAADVCTQCGAEYLPADVDKQVEEIVKDALSKKIEPHQEEVYRVTV